MPRQPRLCLADIPTHVVQRGHNREACFISDGDRLRYLLELGRHTRLNGVAVHAYVLMTNHVHLLMTPRDDRGISRAMKGLGECYVRHFNRVHGRSGTLWESRPYSSLIETECYLLVCHRYIECNPVRAGMVADPGDYRWSSFGVNAFGERSMLVSPHSVVVALGATAADRQAAYRALFQGQLDDAELKQIRSTTQGGFALGSDAFCNRVAAALGRPAARRRPGPPPLKG